VSREIRIGATEPAPAPPAFSVSRDSGGILIGVRDNAAPQFAVSRDTDGLLLSAWPVVPSSTFHSLQLHAAYVGSVYNVQGATSKDGAWPTPGYPLFMGAGHFEADLYAFDGLMQFDTSTLPANDLGAEPTAARLFWIMTGTYGSPPPMELRLGTAWSYPPVADDWKTTAEYLALPLLGTLPIISEDWAVSGDFAASNLNMDGTTYFYLSWIGRDGDPADWAGYANNFADMPEQLYLEVDYGTP